MLCEEEAQKRKRRKESGSVMALSQVRSYFRLIVLSVLPGMSFDLLISDSELSWHLFTLNLGLPLQSLSFLVRFHLTAIQ